MKKVIPEVVSTDPEGYESITYDKLTAVLAEAIKEQQKEIADKQAQLDNQQKEIDSLKETINNLPK
jgi:hypothetical protein